MGVSFNLQTLLNFWNQYSQEVIATVAIILGTIVGFYILKTYLLSYIRKFNENPTIAIIEEAVSRIGVATATVTALYFVSQNLSQLPGIIKTIGYFAFILIWTWQVIVLISRVVDFGAKAYMQRSSETSNQAIIRFLANATKITIWILAGLLILSNLGYDVNSLIAGLGVGGIAVALAVQAVLGDIISSISIVVDKPFRVGDFIIVGDLKGTVDKIGLRSTRVTSIDGEEIIMPNSELVSSNIRNFGRMRRRRSLHTIGLTYESDSNMVKQAPEMIKAILRANEMVEEDSMRVHIVGYGDFSVNIEVHFYVTTVNYIEFLDIQQDILVQIREKLEAEELEFAYPTQTVIVNK